MDTQAQTELEQLRAEIAELRKALSDKQQLEQPNLPALRDNFEFVTDMARFSEQLEGYSEKDLRKKWKFTEENWTALGNDDELFRIIEAEKLRRVRDGSFKRERSQQLVTKAPDVLSGLLLNEKNSPKHRIDAAKVLDAMADPGSQNSHNDSERVLVTITLSADEKLTFGGSVKPTPNDTKTIDAVPGFMIPAKETNDGGQPL